MRDILEELLDFAFDFFAEWAEKHLPKPVWYALVALFWGTLTILLAVLLVNALRDGDISWAIAAIIALAALVAAAVYLLRRKLQ